MADNIMPEIYNPPENDDSFLEFFNGPPNQMLQEKTVKNYNPEIPCPPEKRCEHCKKHVGRNVIIHRNICQTDKQHKFCSKVCKIEWCKEFL